MDFCPDRSVVVHSRKYTHVHSWIKEKSWITFDSNAMAVIIHSSRFKRKFVGLEVSNAPCDCPRISCCLAGSVSAQLTVDQRLAAIESRQEAVIRDADHVYYQLVLATSLLCAFFCAAWAQTTGRSAWHWFLLGLFLTYLALIALLVKNSADREKASDKNNG
jgi:hypothetical protein